MRRASPLALLALLLVALVPVTSAAPVDLYLHVDGLQDMAMTTAAPPTEHAETVSAGALSPSGCIRDPLEAQSLTRQQHHTWYAFVQPSIVPYGPGGPDSTHDRGLATDLLLNDVSPTMTWFMAADNLPGDVDGAIAVVPQVVIRATMRTGDDISVGNQAFNSGDVVAQGEIGPVDLYPGVDHPGVTQSMVDGVTVFGFSFPLALLATNISAEDAFNLRIDAFVQEPFCQEGKVMPDWLHVHTSAEHRPRLQLDVANPIALVGVHAAFTDGDLHLRVEPASPFGRLDNVIGFDSEAEFEVLFRSNGYPCHGCIEINEWTVTIRDVAALPDGDYAVTITAWNLQQTAHVNVTGVLTVKAGNADFCMENGCLVGQAASKATPGVPLALSLLIVVGIALARRR